MIFSESKHYVFGRFLVWLYSDEAQNIVLVPRNAIVNRLAVLKESRRPRKKPRAFRLRRKWSYVLAFDEGSVIDPKQVEAAMAGLDTLALPRAGFAQGVEE